MSLHSLPLFVRMAGRAVILLGDGEAAAAKRRLLERSGATIVGEAAEAALAIVAIEDDAEALAAIARLKARGVLVNAVDRPEYCDFTVPAIIDRAPVLIAIGTGGVSAGLAAALRQRLEALLPAGLGALATALLNRRERIRAVFPGAGDRRRALALAMSVQGPLDPLAPSFIMGGERYEDDVDRWLAAPQREHSMLGHIFPMSANPDHLRVSEARWLALADRVFYDEGVPVAILDRARADAPRIRASDPANDEALPGLSIHVHYAAPQEISAEDAEVFGIDTIEDDA